MTKAHDKYETAMPLPPRRHLLASLRAHCAGRRDGRRGAAADADGHRSFTRVLETRAHRGQARVDGYLRAGVQPVDCQIAALAEELAAGARQRAEIESAEKECDSKLVAASPTVRVALARRGSRLQAELRALTERSGVAARELAALLHTRRHLLEDARAGAAAWEAYYRVLAANYQRGYERRDPSAAPTPPPLGRFLAWVSGDLPLLVVELDADANELIRLALGGFLPAPLIE